MPNAKTTLRPTRLMVLYGQVGGLATHPLDSMFEDSSVFCCHTHLSRKAVPK